MLSLLLLVTTEFLSRQNYVCHDKHVFVATKMILMAAPANDRCGCWWESYFANAVYSSPTRVSWLYDCTCQHRLVRESPRWLASNDRYDEANAVLEEVARVNGKPSPPKIQKGNEEAEVTKESPLRMFTNKTTLIRTLIIFLNWSVCSSICFALRFKHLSLSLSVSASPPPPQHTHTHLFPCMSIEVQVYPEPACPIFRVRYSYSHSDHTVLKLIFCLYMMLSIGA